MNCTLSAGRLPDGLDLLSFFDGLVFFAPVSLLVRTTAGISAGQFFLLQAVISAASLVGEMPCGRLTDRIGYRNTIRLCEGCFFLARALLLIAFLTRSLPLFVLEAAVEGLAISLESGTWDAYLYGALPADRYLPKKARMENWGTAGFLLSTLGYVGLYAAGGLLALLGATVCASGAAFGLAFTLPREAASTRREQEAARPAGGLGRLLRSRQAWFLMGLLAALSLGRLLVNFFYAERLGACGLGELWMTPVILGYSCIQMLAAPILGRLRQRKLAVAGFCVLAGVGMALLGVARQALPALALMLVLPLLLAVPSCIVSLWQNALIDRQGQEERRAEALSAFHMASSVFELAFLLGSSAIAALGPAACFGAVGAALAGLGAAALRAGPEQPEQ